MTQLLAIGLCVAAAAPDDRPEVLLVVGAPGAPEYGAMFGEWADQWQAAAAKGSAPCTRIGPGTESAKQHDREKLREFLAAQAESSAKEPLWVVLI
ncbi:MAG TPA: hypothetical protein VIL46_10530, partial [Gemmataceae bacterium]